MQIYIYNMEDILNMIPKNKRLKVYLFCATVLLGYFVQSVLHHEEGPVVEISTGKIQGRLAQSRDGRSFTEFLGIPFAKPPIHSLRFEPPELPRSWKGIRPAYSAGPQCFGAELLTTGRVVGQEDCLYLNVHTPGFINSTTSHAMREWQGELLPVIVYIHGGGFFMGNTDLHGAKYFMDEDVVLVTMNYRLGAFGFLNTGDGVVRGNMGLKDQNLALKWVQQNIIQFGGNPSQVTLAGESAGGASVHAHMLSPLSKGLFHRAIVTSMSIANTDWAVYRNQTDSVVALGDKVGCYDSNTKDLVKCLKRTSGYKLMAAHLNGFDPRSHTKHLFVPTVEFSNDTEAFVPDDPIKLMKQGLFNNVPCIGGLVEHEGLIHVLRVLHHNMSPLQMKDSCYRNKYLGNLLAYHSGDEELWDNIYNFYFNSSETMDDMIVSLSNLLTDRFVAAGMRNMAKFHSRKSPFYLFYMTYTPQFNIFDFLRGIVPPSWVPFELQAGFHLVKDFFAKLFGNGNTIYGASHGDDTPLLFNSNPLVHVWSFSRDYTFSKDLVKLHVDFASEVKKLQFRGVNWQPVNGDSTDGLTFLRLDSKPEMIPDPYSQRMKFFNSLNIT